jgi:hypothetical protein
VRLVVVRAAGIEFADGEALDRVDRREQGGR